MVLAQLTRIMKPVGVWASANRTPLGVIAQLGILLMVLFGSIQMGLRLETHPDATFWGSAAVLVVAMGALHFSVLFLGIRLARLIGCEPSEQIAVGISGSQKSLMVGLTTCLEFQASVLPIVIFHTIQLIGDISVADWFRKRHIDKLH